MPLGGDYGVLPPVPLNRPASAIGWAYVEPGRHGAAPGFAPPFQPAGVPQHLRRPASTVPEDAEVLAVMARTAATYKDTQQPRPRGLPPSVPEETGWGGGAQGSGPVVSSRLGNSGGSGNLSSRSAQYGMLVPPGAGPSADAADASARPASASSLVYEARAKEAEQLYGDRACDMPAQRAFRGCFAPMAAACAPPRGAKEDGEEEEEEEEEPHHQGGGGATLHDSLSNIASFFGVGGGEGNPQQTAAALNAAARRAAFLANVEKKKATQQHQGQGPRGRQAVDPVAAAASYLGDAQAASRYVYQAQQQQQQQQQVPLKTGEEDFTQGELDWQQQQWQQAQGQGQYPAADDGAAWRARLGDGGEAGPPQVTSAGSFGAGVYAAPRGPGR